MDIMRHRHRFVPALSGGRTPGGATEPVLVGDSHPPLRPATSLTVGVIDTGIVLGRKGRPHPWFGDDHLSYCRADDEDVLAQGAGKRAPADGHGTFVAGVVLREAPTARIRMWGVLDKKRVPTDFDGLIDDDDAAVAAAIGALAINPHVQVINLSFGGGFWAEGSKPPRLQYALERLFAARTDVAVVASAGNEPTSPTVWPAAFDNVVSVGALDETKPLARGDTPPFAPFSNSGDWIDAFAGGVDVLGPFGYPDGTQGWARWSGTSFAAAIVSGRIAQVAIERGINGALAVQAVLEESEPISGRTAVWVRGVDSLPFAQA
jgi:hypothetical protein